MMIALAQRCEESIMDDPEAGNRTGVWFWAMISNLSLDCMSDDDFDELYVEEHVRHFWTASIPIREMAVFSLSESHPWTCAGWRSGHS